MRVLVAHPGVSYSVADVFTGWCKGLRETGCEVGVFNLDDRLDFYSAAMLDFDGELRKALSTDAAVALTLKGLEAACYEFWPHVVVMVSGFFLDEGVCELIRKRGHKLVLIHTESPYEDDRQVDMAQMADLNVINDPTNLERFPRGVYIPHGYDPSLHHPQPATKGMESEFCFVGTGYPSRIEFFEQVDWTGIDANLAGNWQSVEDSSPLVPFLTHERGECVDNTETVQRYCSTLTSCNLYRVEAERPEHSHGWAMSPREVEMAACRTWFARAPRGEGDDVLPMLPTFTDPAELGPILRWALDHPEEREAAALKAQGAIADRTFARHAAELLSLLDT